MRTRRLRVQQHMQRWKDEIAALEAKVFGAFARPVIRQAIYGCACLLRLSLGAGFAWAV